MEEDARLSRRTAATKDLLLKEVPKVSGIVHIGLGNFHRAHLAVYTALAMQERGGNWGICTYSIRSEGLTNSMNDQDNLYSILEIGPDTESAIIPGIHTKSYAGPKDLQSIIDQIANADTKIVSLTITEAGYFISQSSQGLDINHLDIQSDLISEKSKTIYGILAQALKKRAKDHGEPISILSCDNISSNGTKFRRLLLEFIELMPDSGLLSQYLKESTAFPNSMVDRIVPGTEPRHLAIANSRLGLIDSIPVPAEKFTMWALEDNFIAGRPAWEVAGAIFTNDVSSFEIMKLRLLNGSHSLIAYLGALRGHQTIPEARFDTLIDKALNQALFAEYLPSVKMPIGIIAEVYIDQLFQRWSNTFLEDKVYRVGTDGSSKLPQRITEPALLAIRSGSKPKMLALTVSSWLMCIAPFNAFDSGPVAKQMRDPFKEKLQELSTLSNSPSEFIDRFFKDSGVFSIEIASNPVFTSLVRDYFEAIYSEGIAKVIEREI